MKRKRKSHLDENIPTVEFSESTRKELKAKVHGINGELAELARKKLLKQALKTFNSYASKGVDLLTIILLTFPILRFSFSNL